MVVRESNGYRKVREDTGGSGRVMEGPGRSWRIWADVEIVSEARKELPSRI